MRVVKFRALNKLGEASLTDLRHSTYSKKVSNLIFPVKCIVKFKFTFPSKIVNDQ